MFNKVFIPIDLQHAEKLEKAISVGTQLAKSGNLPVVFAAVTSAAPGAVAHTPDEFRSKLNSFATQQAEQHGVITSGHAVFVHDPSVELESALLNAIRETKSDLVVMATHIPHLSDHVWPSNGGRIASHADVSVFLVR
ncbi:universal stress protein [Roseibium denhamense]|uniref:Nucleotide-binding universal stress protein, UspA family n=1 Tax=Roseibium denhamense TaxID=76305 RepID=A0ABY1NKX0_9HYPH|nr:universal stress protein [Roseibium denhamense]MTI06876.1 universal stress protein [Roseibium denhamense]SMP12294.1 Nucleotide-binding universal stress protein, UspA family [Roseibium denhamense]